MNDSLSNFVSGIAGSKDKAIYSTYVLNMLTRDQVEAAFRGDWIARKAVVIPADDSTRAWRSWQAEKSDITKIEEAERTLGLQSKLRRAEVKARLYGGGALVMGVATLNPPNEELNVDAVRQGDLKFVHAVSRYQIQAVDMNRDLSSPYFGEPTMYRRTLPDGTQYDIHPSRVVRLIGDELPDEFSDSEGWGDPILQAVNDAVRDTATVQAAISSLVHEAKFDVIRIPGLADKLSTAAGTNRLIERFTNADKAKSFINSLLLDKEEEWQRVASSFTQLPEVIYVYLMIASGAVDIPATRFLAQSPAGMNSTGESDIRNYYDRLASTQTNRFNPALARLDEVLLRSALGSRPDDVHSVWNPLWQLNDEQKAKIAESQAKVFQTDLDSGLFSQNTMREARANQIIENSTYPGFEQAAEDDLAEREDADGADIPTDPVTGQPMAIAPDGTAVSAEPQKEALNGTQITSLREIVEATAGEQIPPETAKAMIRVAFPTLEEEEINAIIDPLASFEPKPDPIEVAKAEALANPPPPGAAPGAARPAPRPVPVPRAANDRRAAFDATPRSLYCRRDLVNVDEVANWFNAAGFDGDLRNDLHVTIAYSRAAVDWMKVSEAWDQDEGGQLVIRPGGVWLIERMGPEQDYIALLFVSSALSWRHESIISAGASFDWPEYQPHMTLFRGTITTAELKVIEPYRGRLVFGPEVFEEVKP